RVPVAKSPQRYEANAGFDQSTRQQKLLDALVPVPNCYGLLVQVESLPRTAGENHVHCARGETVHAVQRACAVQVATEGIKAVQQTMAIIEFLRGNGFSQPQVIPPGTGRREWPVSHAQISRFHAGRQAAQTDERRHSLKAAAPYLGND